MRTLTDFREHSVVVEQACFLLFFLFPALFLFVLFYTFVIELACESMKHDRALLS